MTRQQLHSQFAAEFQRGSRPVRVSLAELNSLEHDLGVMLPDAYRTFLLQQGSVATPTIPGLAEESRGAVWPLLAFCPPWVVLAETRSAWESGLSRSLIVLAKGPSETLFCLEHGPKGRRADDGAVWGFDPRAGDPVRMTDSFDAWLHEYLEAVYEDDEFLGAMNEVTDQAVGNEFTKRTKP